MNTYVYFIQVDNSIKIGVAKSIRNRMKSIQTHNPGKVKFIQAIECPTRKLALALENRIHYWQRKHRIRGEWFRPDCLDGFDKNVAHLNGSAKILKDIP